MGTDHVIDGDPDLVAWVPLDGTCGEAAQPDFRSLQVREDPYGAAGVGGGLADRPVHPLVVAPVTVTEVQPGNVHAGLDQLGDPLQVGTRGPEGTNDLRAAAVSRPRGAGRYPASCLPTGTRLGHASGLIQHLGQLPALGVS
jgi:hypothetical protein